VREGTEVCDGTDATACPNACLADCTCPPQTCGNNVQEGTEACDGSDATACPGSCLATCSCPLQCPSDGAVGRACNAYSDSSPNGSCYSCCQADTECAGNCDFAASSPFSCAGDTLNDLCAANINAAGCAEECCTSCGDDIQTCQAAIARPECVSCCSSSFSCTFQSLCTRVIVNGCADPVETATCAATINAVGCGFDCCG